MKKVGLVLGGGAARGWAHIGVIEVLRELGVKFHCVVGTSMGALVGAVFVLGDLSSLKDAALRLDLRQILSFLDVVFPISGLIDGTHITEVVKFHLEEHDIESSPIKFAAVATDVLTGEEVVLDKGSIISAVRASISIPGMFTPVKLNGKILVDGGIVNPVPVDVARRMGANEIVAVDVNADILSRRQTKFLDSLKERQELLLKFEKKLLSLRTKREGVGVESAVLEQARRFMTREPLPNIFDILVNSIYIMQRQITIERFKRNKPDVLIQPKLGHIKFLEFHRAEEAIKIGYEEASAHAKKGVFCS